MSNENSLFAILKHSLNLVLNTLRFIEWAVNTVLREVGVHVINEVFVSCVIVVQSALGLRSRDIPHLVRQ